MAFEKKIKLEILGTDFEFTVSGAAYDKLQTELVKPKPKHKQAFTNFLTGVVNDKQRNDLIEIVKKPGAPFEIASALIEEYQDDLGIVVKK